MERAFRALFGCNAYLTPTNNQGLAPHFDDVEVFMLQLEGAKHWRLHAPPASEEYPLPRDYSRDFVPDELGEMLMECTLEAGELLYLPRGTVHSGVATARAKSAESCFSHHLTVSTYQKTAWCHLMERALSSALERAAAQSAEFRGGLPVGFLDYMGSWHDSGGGDHSGEVAAGRASFKRRLQGLLRALPNFIDVDEVCDELGVDFMSQRMPPCLEDDSRRPTGSVSAQGDDASSGVIKVTPDTCIRWVDASAVRAMMSTDPETSEPTVMLFHSRGNSRDQHMNRAVEPEEEVGCLRFDAATFLPAIRMLCAAQQEWVRCADLPLTDDNDKALFSASLLEARLLQTRPPPAAGASTGVAGGHAPKLR